MTPAEYLEFVQEALSFPPDGIGRDSKWLLYATLEQCSQLSEAHNDYVVRVAQILKLEIPLSEASIEAVCHKTAYSYPLDSEGGSAD